MVGLVSLLVLKHFRPEWATLLRLGMTVLLLGFLLALIIEVMDFAQSLGEETLLPSGMWQILCKALGIALMTEVAAGVCRDCGEGSMAQWVEAFGRLEILVLSFPLVTEILTTAKNLLSIT